MRCQSANAVTGGGTYVPECGACETVNAVKRFSATANPNGAWSDGSEANPGNAFTAFTVRRRT
jgi:hypothetical protein